MRFDSNRLPDDDGLTRLALRGGPLMNKLSEQYEQSSSGTNRQVGHHLVTCQKCILLSRLLMTQHRVLLVLVTWILAEGVQRPKEQR